MISSDKRPAISYDLKNGYHMPDVPLYGTICRSGKEWTVTLKEVVTSTGSTINGTSSGYGPFPFDKYPGIPVIDFSGESIDRCFEGLKIHDHLKPHMGSGTVPEFIQAHKALGFKVIEP